MFRVTFLYYFVTVYLSVKCLNVTMGASESRQPPIKRYSTNVKKPVKKNDAKTASNKKVNKVRRSIKATHLKKYGEFTCKIKNKLNGFPIIKYGNSVYNGPTLDKSSENLHMWAFKTPTRPRQFASDHYFMFGFVDKNKRDCKLFDVNHRGVIDLKNKKSDDSLENVVDTDNRLFKVHDNWQVDPHYKCFQHCASDKMIGLKNIGLLLF